MSKCYTVHAGQTHEVCTCAIIASFVDPFSEPVPDTVRETTSSMMNRRRKYIKNNINIANDMAQFSLTWREPSLQLWPRLKKKTLNSLVNRKGVMSLSGHYTIHPLSSVALGTLHLEGALRGVHLWRIDPISWF